LSGELQGVAQRYNIPIIAMSQVNRLGISKEPPGAEHLSQADAIGHDADVVLTMTQRTSSVMKMKLAKFRHGPGGATWYARFSPGTGEYEEVSVQDAEAAMEADLEVD
jgi:replicative DNA helicase